MREKVVKGGLPAIQHSFHMGFVGFGDKVIAGDFLAVELVHAVDGFHFRCGQSKEIFRVTDFPTCSL